MASKQQAISTSKFRKPYEIKLNKWQVLRNAVWLLVLVVVAWIALSQIQRQIAIHQQQQRFDGIRTVQRSFETNVKQLLASSLTDMEDSNYCHYLAQTDFSRGRLWCGIGIQGTTNELPGEGTSGSSAWDTIARIDAVAHDTISKSGISFTSLGWSPGKPATNDTVVYDDFFYLFGMNVVRCDVTGTKPYDQVLKNSAVSVKHDQLYFTFSCQQRSSKNFFTFTNS